MSRQKRPPLEKICEACGVMFLAKTTYQREKQRFCGHACRSSRVGKRVKMIRRKCRQCGEWMLVWPCHKKTKHYCSRSCAMSHRMRGEGNTAWLGGSAVYWKRQARERDDFTCQFPGCGKRHEGKGTHAHHKIPAAVGGAHELDNLITLCGKHHRETERRLFTELVRQCPKRTRRIAKALYTELAI